MTEVWIHRNCASDEDEMIEPTTFCKDQVCQYCGEPGRVHLYVWDERTKIVANENGALFGEVTESISEDIPEIYNEPEIQKAILKEVASKKKGKKKKEVAESIPEIDMSGGVDVDASELGKDFPTSVEAESVTEDVSAAIEEAEDETVIPQAEEVKEVPVKVTIDASEAIEVLDELENKTKSIDEQITALQAKKAELKK